MAYPLLSPLPSPCPRSGSRQRLCPATDSSPGPRRDRSGLPAASSARRARCSDKPRDDVGVLLGHVGKLRRIAGNVVQLDAAAVGIQQQLPVAVANGQHRAVMKGSPAMRNRQFHISGVLRGRDWPEQDVAHVLAVERVVLRNLRRRPACRRVGSKSQPATTDVSSIAPGRHMARPADDERHAHAAFVQAALAAAERPALSRRRCGRRCGCGCPPARCRWRTGSASCRPGPARPARRAAGRSACRGR